MKLFFFLLFIILFEALLQQNVWVGIFYIGGRLSSPNWEKSLWYSLQIKLQAFW